MTKKKHIIIFNIIILLLFVVFLFIITKFVFIPSSHSIMLSCYPEQINNSDIRIAGEIVFDKDEHDDTYEYEIRLYSEDPKVLKHELCHYSQFVRGFPSLSCKHIIQKYLSEIECYSVQYLPDFIFEKIYVEIPEF